MEIEWSGRAVSGNAGAVGGGDEESCWELRVAKKESGGSGRGETAGRRDGFVEETHEDGCGQAGKLFGMGTAVSCGNCDSQGGGTELDLGSGEPLDDDHRRATVGTKPKRARFPGRGCFWFGLGGNSAEGWAGQREERGAAPGGEE